MCCSKDTSGNGTSGISHKDCIRLLNQVLDDEVNEEIKGKVLEHMKSCMPCYERFNLDMAIKDLLKSRCCNKTVPKDLAQMIRGQISSLPG